MDEVKKISEQFGREVVRLAKKNLADRKISAGGDLRRSMSSSVRSSKGKISVIFEMEDYGALRDAGQLGSKRKILKGWNKSVFLPRGKGFTTKAPPPQAIQKWIRTKPIRSQLSLKSLSFLIARKIKTEGITPGLFFSDAYNDKIDEFENDLLAALGVDVEKVLD